LHFSNRKGEFLANFTAIVAGRDEGERGYREEGVEGRKGEEGMLS